jgi:phosphatidylserine/phosphatidylglycerophosphate/cardiolipin synthase-like enzyme
MTKQPFLTAEVLAKFASSTPPLQLRSIASALLDETINLRSSAYGIGNCPGVTLETASRAFAALGEIERDTSAEEVASILVVVARTSEIFRSDSPQLETVWTGPQVVGPHVRSTDLVIQEMLGAAQTSGEILMVGYSLTVGNDSAMTKVVDMLKLATSRGVQIRVVLHSDDDEHENRENLMTAWDVLVKKPEVYTWKPKNPDKYTKLHAKCLVVDRVDALVTSANFTFHGLESNLELGVRVRGGHAGSIAEIFDNLISSGELVSW